jgi:hypothetical protein
MELNMHLTPIDDEPLEDCYIVGSLVYFSVTRPDISYSKYSHLLCVVRYLCGTFSHRLFFSRSSSLQVQTYCDATWASDPSDCRSFCLLFFLDSSLIAWKTKKHVVVSRSCAEAELCAIALVVLWHQRILMKGSDSHPPPVSSLQTQCIQRS